MTTIENASDAVSGAHSSEPTSASRALHGVSEWVTTADHKKIGQMFIADGVLLGLAVAIVGALIGVERVSDGIQLDSGIVPQLFTLYRAGLAIFVALPIVVGLCVAVVPLQIGARAIAFGRATALGFWLWFGGAVLAIISVLSNGGPGGDNNYVVLWLAATGLSLLGLAIAMGTVVVSVLTTRAPGMTIKRVPMFAYSALVGGAALILTLAAACGTVLLLLIDNRFSATRAGFSGNGGLLPIPGIGDGRWLHWMVSTPAMLVYALPLLGALPDVIGTMTGAHNKQRWITRLGIGLASLISLSAVMQRTLGFDWNADRPARTFFDIVVWLLFSGLPILGVLAVLGTTGLMIGPKPNVKALATAPVAFVFLGGGMVLTGFLTNVVMGVRDWQLLGSTFEEGSALYAGYGAVLIALGGLAYWGAKLTGRLIPSAKALPLAALGFIGTVLSALPLVLLGFNDQEGWMADGFTKGGLAPELLNTLVVVGHALMALSLLAVGGLALMAFLGSGEAAGDDPFDGQTLEWATSSPPPGDNFAEVATVSSAHPLTDLKPSKAV